MGPCGEEGAPKSTVDDAFAFVDALDHEETEAGGGLDDGVSLAREVGVEFFERSFPECRPRAEAEMKLTEVCGEVIFTPGAHDAFPGDFPPAFGHATGLPTVEK